MSDLISRQAAIDALGGNEPVGDPSKWDDDDVVKMWERIRIINIINKLPSAQPERGRGEWIETSESIGWEEVGCAECSVCGKTLVLGDYTMDDIKFNYNYCPNCGAEMRGDDD